MIPDCENCEYQDEEGRCTAFIEDIWNEPLPCEVENEINNDSNRE